MKKYKTLLAQFCLGLTIILATTGVIYGTVHTVPVAASNLPSPQIEAVGETAAVSSASTITPTNCRYGVSSLNNNDFNFIQDLGIGWVLNFTVNFNRTFPDGVEYTPMIRFKPELDGDGERTGNYRVTSPPFTDESDGLGPIIAANPGRLWIVGNEVDRIYAQDDLMPEVYAQAYHDAYHFIKARDPLAQVAISALVEVTPGRLQYLDLVWDSYLEMYGTAMPVDVWNMHIYILPEITSTGQNAEAAVALGTDPDLAILQSGNNKALCSNDNVYCYAEHDDMSIFAEQVVSMRQWMKAHGQQNKPLVLSEYSLLYPYDDEGDSDPSTCYLKDEYGNCFTPDRVSQYMRDTFDYLETTTSTSLGFPADNYRMVQQWLWFTIQYGWSSDAVFSSDLLEAGYTSETYTMRLPGQTFMNELDLLRPFTTNPFVGQVSYPTARTITPTGTTSATIAATIYNNGDTEMTTPVTVTFYSDAKTQQIGTAVVPAGLAGCARRADQAEVVWENLSTGVHAYWAQVEGGNTVAGFVIINPDQAYLPAVMR